MRKILLAFLFLLLLGVGHASTGQVVIIPNQTVFNPNESIQAIEQNVSVLYDLTTYIRNQVSTHMSMSGTDYQISDTGKTFVQLDIGGTSVNNASCLINVWYPNSTALLQNTFMQFLAQGIYYYDFVAPTIVGVYPVSVQCDYVLESFRYNVTTPVRILGLGAGATSNLNTIDGVFWDMTENVGDNRRVAANFTFTGVTFPNTTQTYSILLTARRSIQGTDPASDPIVVSYYNFSTNRFVPLSSQFSYTSGVVSFTYTLSGNVTQYVNPSGTVIVQINDTIDSATDPANTNLEIDQLNIVASGTIGNTVVQTIRGSGEWNIRNTTTNISGILLALSQINSTVNNISNRVNNLTLSFNGTINVSVNVTVINQSVNLSEFNQTVTSIVNEPRPISLINVLLVLEIVLLLLLFFIKRPFIFFLTGSYMLLFGFQMMRELSLFVGIINAVVGLAVFVIGWWQVKR